MSDKVEKAAATRARKKEDFCLMLLAELESDPPRSVWQFAYDLRCSTDSINHVLDEDERFIGPLNRQRVAIPAHSLRDPKWMRHVLDRATLPTVRADEKISTDSLPVPIVGDPTREADYLGMEIADIGVARRLVPRKAREFIDDKSIAYSKMIHEDFTRIRETEVLRLDNQQKAAQITRLENDAIKSRKSISALEQKVERFERITGSDMPPPVSPSSEGARPNA